MLGMGRPILTRADLEQHRAQLGNQQDVIYAPLFDSVGYASAGALQLTFFTSPIGQGTTTAPGASGTKTLADTNLYSAGQLTKGNEFYMTGQEFMFLPGANPGQPGLAPVTGAGAFVNDNWVVGKSGVVTLQVGSNRQYIQDGPLMLFPPNAGLYVSAALAMTTTAGTQSLASIDYARWAGEPYEITPIYIEANQGFQEFIQWPALVTTASTGRLFSRMRGYLVRNAQ